jgi:branched-subunit amino acid aminotransferase/4-amino-4-deoxychorismate lyase
MKITKKQLLKFNPCRDGLAFAESCNFDFSKIYETCERSDWLIWLLRKTNAITKPQAVLLACECAEHVLAIYEKKFPADKRPRQAIEAARKWVSDPTEENRSKCRAAYAAYASASASASAAASAYASAAYASAAYAAADAASASAAAYASAASDAARTTERKWQADKIREIILNPFK